MSIEYGVLIQARTGSSRTPNKISHLILGREMLYHQIRRLQENGIGDIFIATTNNRSDNKIEKITDKCNVQLFRGSEDDVLERFYFAAREFKINNIIRVGGDDPLIDPNCIHSLMRQHRIRSANFIYASHKQGWIYGTAAELIEFDALENAHRLATSPHDKEHIITFFKNNSEFTEIKISPLNKSEIRDDIFLSVDYREDLDLIEQILIWFDSQNKLYTFSQRDLIELYDSGTLDIRNRDLHQGFSN